MFIRGLRGGGSSVLEQIVRKGDLVKTSYNLGGENSNLNEVLEKRLAICELFRTFARFPFMIHCENRCKTYFGFDSLTGIPTPN